MAQLKVIVAKLNRRRAPISQFSEQGKVVGTVFRGFQFVSVNKVVNELGNWYMDADGNYYWGGGLSILSSEDKVNASAAKTGKFNSAFKINVNKLNLRSGPATDFANKENVVGVLHKDAVFESVAVLENELGKWQIDIGGNCVSEKWLGQPLNSNFLSNDKKNLVSESIFGWGLQQLSIEDFWQTANNRGENITIAILDTGISSIHPEFDFTNIIRMNVLNGDNVAEDTNGHGSHVAGIIGAQGKKIIGASPKAKLLIIKVAENIDSWDIGNVLKGVQHAIDAQVDIISISGEFSESDTEIEILREKITEASAKGIITIASAGNNFNDFPVESFPAAFDECISVGSIKRDGTRADSSSHSSKLDVVSPGEEIYSAWIGNNYHVDSGTSMATPLVSGIVAVIKSFAKTKLSRNLSPSEIQILINKSADDIGAKGFDTSYGFGIINPTKALKMLAP